MVNVDYKAAGVDIEAGNQAVRQMKKWVEGTFSPHVLTGIGGFGAMYDIKYLLNEYAHPVLVQSIDGVGTKMMVATRMQKFDTIGMDLVSATANDIVVMGAKPLTLLDYIANDKLNPDTVEQIVKGMAVACQENDISLIGGETAEMPGTYLSGELDLVGIVTGVVDKEKAIDGKNIEAGDVIAMLPSSGLHTNGYSLARKLLFDVARYNVETKLDDFPHRLGEELLTPHLNYTKPVLALLKQGLPIKGMAHITGGGLLENVPRILPSHLAAEIFKNKIPEQPIFNVLSKLSALDDNQLYRVFNMGAGLILVFSPSILSAVRIALQNYPAFPLYEIGQIVEGSREVKLL